MPKRCFTVPYQPGKSAAVSRSRDCLAGCDLCRCGQTEPLSLHRRRVPPRPTPRVAYAHRLELGGNLLKRAIGRCRLNAGDQPNKAIVASLRPGAIQQARLDDAFRGQPPYGAPQSFDRPGVGPPAVQDPHDIVPGLIGAHQPDGREPCIQPLQNTFEMGSVAAGAYFADGSRITGAQARIAANPAACTRRTQASFITLGDQGSFELSHRT